MRRFRKETFIYFILSTAIVHGSSLSRSLRQIKYTNVEHLTNVPKPAQVITGNSETCDCGVASSSCLITPKGEKYCSCWSNYAQKFGKCEECNCGDNRYVRECKFNVLGEKVCECEEKYSSMNGKCVKCECGEHSSGCTFDDKGSMTCQCLERYAFRNGKCTVTCNGDSDCFNGRICRKEAEGSFCDCPINYTGEKCETLIACEKLNSKCLSMAGYCEVRGLSAACVCPAGQSIGSSGVCAVSGNNTLVIVIAVFGAVLMAGLLIGGIYLVAFKRICSRTNPHPG